MAKPITKDGIAQRTLQEKIYVAMIWIMYLIGLYVNKSGKTE